MARSRNAVAMLPVSIIGKAQLSHLQRELQYLDEAAHQKALGQRGVAGRVSAAIGDELMDLLAMTGYSLDTSEERQRLKEYLSSAASQAPEYHVSFASEPPAHKLQQVVRWLREAVHPQLLVRVGLQPSIIAGCVIRTNNRVIDLSLRRSFEAAAPVLLKEVKAL